MSNESFGYLVVGYVTAKFDEVYIIVEYADVVVVVFDVVANLAT